METRFLADTMLGRLTKWLRVMGYDTLYQSRRGIGMTPESVGEGRVILSRDLRILKRYPAALPIRSDLVRDQILEVKEAGYLGVDRLLWFSRCLICNVPLREAATGEARENVPEHVFYENASRISYCPSCRRFYWPGSHRKNMTDQLRQWGF